MSDTQEPQETQAARPVDAPQETHETQAHPAEPTATGPDTGRDDLAPSLGALITSIRAAVARSASPEARAVGASACRSILTVLEAKPGQPLGTMPQPAPSAASPITALLKQPGFLNQLAGMSREQLLDLLKQVTGAMPARAQAPASAAPRFHLIQIPQARRPDGR
jgi:hypothetical protein